MRYVSRRNFLRNSAMVGAIATISPGILAACGDDGGGSSGGNLGAGSIQFSWIKNVEFAGSYIADTNGYYKKNGLASVELKSGGPNVPTEPVVQSGQATIGYTFSEPLGGAMKEGAKFKIIAAMFQKNPFGILSVEGKPIRTPQDLIGKKIGVQAVNEPIWDALLKINKLDASKITKVPVQFDPAPLVKGEVDGWFAFVINEPITVKEQGGKPVVMPLQDVGFKVFQQLVIVSEETLSKERNKVKALLKSELMGWQQNMKDPSVGAKLTVEKYGKDLGLKLAHEEEENRLQIELMKSPTTDAKGLGYMSAEDIDSNLKVLGEMGITSIKKDTYTNSLLDEIYKDGIDLLK